MNKISRRTVTRIVGVGTIAVLAGCIVDDRNDEPNPQLRLFPTLEHAGSTWTMTVRARHTTDWDASIHDVTIIGFNAHGEEVCREHVGDFPARGRIDETVTITCEEFPAIITAIAEETPCDGAFIRLISYTSSEDPQTVDDINDSRIWEGTWRECDEDLPPQRVLDNVSRSDGNG